MAYILHDTRKKFQGPQTDLEHVENMSERNTHTKVISIDESIIKWGRPCQMLSFLNKGAC